MSLFLLLAQDAAKVGDTVGEVVPAVAQLTTTGVSAALCVWLVIKGVPSMQRENALERQKEREEARAAQERYLKSIAEIEASHRASEERILDFLEKRGPPR